MSIKTLGLLGKIRVGRVTGNTHIFFFGSYQTMQKCWLILAYDLSRFSCDEAHAILNI